MRFTTILLSFVFFVFASVGAAAYECGEKRYCKDMGSCKEAKFHLNKCGLKKLDRDGDGVPCNKLCKRSAAKAVKQTDRKEFTLASWNVRNLSSKSRSDVELGIIALIIYRYDFIAMQEVLDAEAVIRLQTILSQDFGVAYQVQVSDPVGHNKKERYAFMWREGLIKQLSSNFYKDPGDRFEREPFCGYFKAGGTFDWNICTIHVLFGKNEADRRPEIRQLDEVYRHYRSKEKDVVICGDFNFGPRDEGFRELLAEDGMNHAIAPPYTTTIGDKSLYDNCFWPAASKEIVPDSGKVFEFDELMFLPNSRKLINRLVSDHRPIHVRVNTSLQDDD